MCDKYMYTVSEGAWKSVMSHVSRDTAATIRQAGLHSLTPDRANLHFTHNIHACVYMRIHVYMCIHVHVQNIHALCIIHVYIHTKVNLDVP